MGRRASSSINPIWAILAFAGIAGLCAGAYFMFGTVKDSFRTLTPLPVTDYLQNSNSLRGNSYKIEAVIATQLEWSPSQGRLFSVEAGPEMMAVLVPPQFNQINIEKGQRYQMKVEVGEKGVLRVQEVKKS